jgi:HK97 family phage major capsid protein/HK97 family phage prohead protease
MKHRAYTVFHVKSVDEEARRIRGIATTPSTDRMGDIVEPDGATFSLPLPLLWQHNHAQPIGNVVEASVTKSGIEVVAEFVQVHEPGVLRDRLEEAWQSVKHGLVRGLSIGFQPIEYAEISGSYGIRFIKWAWHELSAVTIPANADATITAIKSAAQAHAASGTRVVQLNKPAGALAKSKPEMNMNIQEQIQAFEAKRLANAQRLEDVMAKAAEEGRTLDDAEKDEYDELSDEVKSIDDHLVRLKQLEKTSVSKATAAPSSTMQNEKINVERGGVSAVVSVRANQAKGVAFAQVVKAIAASKGNLIQAHEVAKSRHPDDPRIANIIKAAVSAGTTSNATWMGALVGDETSVFADFVEFLRPMTILGRFGAGGIPALRTVPFRVPLISQTSGGDGYWVGEGAPKPLTKFDFARTTLEPLKVANIAVATMEALRDSSPSADLLVRDSLAAALSERKDIDFIDPANSGSSGVRPASITNGIAAIPSTGTNAAAVRADLRALLGAFVQANNPPTSGVLVMSSMTALSLSLMQNPLGQPEFPGINMNGGTLNGLPVITSEYMPVDSQGSLVILVNAGDIYYADDGSIGIDASTEASLQMADDPTNNSATPTAAQLVSMFQTNSVAIRAEQTVSWKRRRDSGVAYMTDVLWGIGGE